MGITPPTDPGSAPVSSKPTKSRSLSTLLLILALALTLISFGGYVYYKEFYKPSLNQSSVNTETDDTSTQPSVTGEPEITPIVEAISVEEARKRINDALELSFNSNTAFYTVAGEDGDESMFKEYYTIDNSREYMEVISMTDFAPYRYFDFYKYHIIKGNYYLPGEYDTTLKPEEVSITIKDINYFKEKLGSYLDVEGYSKIATTQEQKIDSHLEVGEAITINVKVQDNTSGLLDFMNAYADYIPAEYKIKAVTYSDGKLRELTLPHLYSYETFWGNSYDSEVGITLPEISD